MELNVNQKIARVMIEDAALAYQLKVRSYGPRGSYGKEYIAVSNFPNEALFDLGIAYGKWHAAYETQGEDDPDIDPQEVYDILTRISADGLGRGTITYWRGLPTEYISDNEED